MRSSKSRSRSKQNRPRTLGNIINRVFDSSGPEGKVRGTPQQIIEKYQLLARDAQLSNDRVAAENFLQHAEHYTRLLAEATREMQAEQEARQQYGQQGGYGQPNGARERQNGDRPARDDEGDERPYMAEGAEDDRSTLVDLPEQNRPARREFTPDRPRDERPRDDRPRDERPRDDRPREERPRFDRPRDDRPRDDRPREDRPRDDRPRDDRPRGDGNRADANRPRPPRDERPREERPQERKPEIALPRFIEQPLVMPAEPAPVPEAAEPAPAKPRARRAAPKVEKPAEE